ncbi:hypothetical protein CRG98_009052 [Punica granatum]|uniref:Uncharacterized protein n=1 Tax=Punica granatum TaxID=22663 RepID=A0A2I0KPY8_PUNGR|nr:hypothetical protein CRG98_009052 [Punica granatum]
MGVEIGQRMKMVIAMEPKGGAKEQRQQRTELGRGMDNSPTTTRLEGGQRSVDEQWGVEEIEEKHSHIARWLQGNQGTVEVEIRELKEEMKLMVIANEGGGMGMKAEEKMKV